MDPATARARARFASSAVARLATADAAGRPHLVPVTFVLDGDALYFAVDRKPKRHREPHQEQEPRGAHHPQSLRRLRNIEANPWVSLLVDHYADDWATLWWARADGRAEILRGSDPARSVAAIERLCAKYPQYAADPPQGPVVAIEVERWSDWSFAGPGGPGGPGDAR
ncbi:TIGR03668 family PPOX class F420-dependent oxidoreductase [Streptomyces sp. NPDC049577]|uniref:TIGR03668 family PPOX class F420-dependent oxidoreductase n=1 Tax=Streptomyces sp. NPDC049577 TaxID=3155153 RepID=UPI00341EF5C8